MKNTCFITAVCLQSAVIKKKSKNQRQFAMICLQGTLLKRPPQQRTVK